jgi:membrane protease YdiL (CAAX protease family)
VTFSLNAVTIDLGTVGGWSEIDMRRLAGAMRRHSVVNYFVIAYAVSWAIWIPMALVGARVYQGSAWPTHVPGLFGPMAAAFAMWAVVGGRPGVKDLLRRMVRWRVAPRWYLVALSPLAFFGLAAVAMEVSGQGWPDLTELGRFSGLPVVAAPVMWLLLLGAGFAEETGWRGFAVPQLLRNRSLLTTALIVGVLWASWHVPSMFVIENYRELGVSFVPGFFIGIVAGSIFLAWLYRASGGSIFIVSLWHATFNLFSGTVAAHGLVAALVSTGVMAWAVVIVGLEVRRWLRSRRSISGLPTAAG